MSIAAAVRSRPRSFISSTALIVKRSSSSRVTGESPAVAIPATASPAPSRVGKNASIVDRGGGAGRSLRVASVMIASVPWLPTKRWVSEYPATSLTFLPPVRMTRAVGHHDLERQHRLAGLAVLDAAQPAGVGAEVPADRAHLERRRIGRVEQPVRRHGRLQRRVDDAGLDHRDEVLAVDLDDAVHRGEGDRQSALDAGRAAGQPGPGAARHDRDAELAGEPHHGGHLGRLGRQDHGSRQARLQIGGLVEAVRLAIGLVGQHPEARELGADRVDERSDRRRPWCSWLAVYGPGVGFGRCADSRSRSSPCSPSGFPRRPRPRRRAVPAPRSVPRRRPSPPARSNRTSLALTATYDASLHIDWLPRARQGRRADRGHQHLGRADRPDRAQHRGRPPRLDALRGPCSSTAPAWPPGSATRR